MLRARGRRDPIVLALLATESFFRPTVWRTFEYFVWAALDSLRFPRANFISVGLSQVQVRHWRRANIISDTTPRLLAIYRFSNPLLSYDACLEFLNEVEVYPKSAAEIAVCYSGRTTQYHVQVLNIFLNFANLEASACASRRVNR
jgi:hypothetical protein